MSATALAQAVHQKKLSPVEIVGEVLRAIETRERHLNAFVTLVPEQALRGAREAEDRLMRGQAGPLCGVPFTAKDTFATQGIRTTFGSRLRENFVPDHDAPAVARLKQAGAILLGKTTTSEFGWTAKGVSPLTGMTRNPWNPALDAGGSSAGAAVAAAASMAPLHLGTDGAGSIRVPAHFCGVFGFKPTYGLVAQFPVSVNDYTSHAGPLTRNVSDAALMLRTIAGMHSADHTSAAVPVPDFPRLLSEPRLPARIAFSPDLGHARVDREVADLVVAAVGKLQSALKIDIEEVTPAWGPKGPELIRFFWPAHLSHFAQLPRQQQDVLDPGLLACAQAGAETRVFAYQKARERKYEYCAEIGRFFDEWDFLLTPVASVTAFAPERLQPPDWPTHGWDWLGWAEFSYPFNFAGNPAASVPCGTTAAGLPCGLQIVGRRFDDLGVLQLSHLAAELFGNLAPRALPVSPTE